MRIHLRKLLGNGYRVVADLSRNLLGCFISGRKEFRKVFYVMSADDERRGGVKLFYNGVLGIFLGQGSLHYYIIPQI
jgi:hypothetical protein